MFKKSSSPEPSRGRGWDRNYRGQKHRVILPLQPLVLSGVYFGMRESWWIQVTREAEFWQLDGLWIVGVHTKRKPAP